MSEVQRYSLIEKLREADETLMGSPSLLGMTALTYPNYINSMRSTMFTSHLKQFLNLKYSQFPFLFTNNENIVGDNSTGYIKAEHNLQVFRKVCKYDDILDKPNIYYLFVYDKENKQYDIIERKVCEDLVENFGYEFKNEIIDKFDEGDTISEDTILTRSTSYDDDMNYGYGRNVTVAYTLDPFTSEDAAIASESLCKQFTSIETETIRIGLNNNDYLLNLYGNKNRYQPLPEIGQMVSDKLCVSRRQFNNQLLFDFKNSTLREILDSDTIYYIDKNVEVIDYTIYNNLDNRVDNPFYDQINKYYDSQMRYHNEIVATCEEIFASGEDYSQELDYLYKRSKDFIDTEKKWRDGDNTPGGIIIEVTIKRGVPLAKGCKITG